MTEPATSANDDFREEVRAFIAKNLPEEMAARTKLGYHAHKPDVVYWTGKLHERGWSVAGWPVEYGGPGWTVAQRHIFEEECFQAGCPVQNSQGIQLVGPIIYTHGSQEQKERFLPGIRTCETFWAQGFSEPNAGSDLAALQTRAKRVGDAYIVNGQKTWTSEAQIADWLFLLVRTDRSAKPQAGISFLLADIQTPGIEIRPIISIDGGHVLNEVFLDDVRVPVENLIGDENMGWTYAKSLLSAERTFSAEVPRCRSLLERARMIASRTLARERPLIEDVYFAHRLAELEIEFIAHEATLLRLMAEEEAGFNLNTPIPSLLKIRGTELAQRIGALTVEALGDPAIRDYPEKDYLLSGAEASDNALAPGVAADFLYRRSMTIYGGTNEIQRNIIAAHLLNV